jgi:hypothetical protein
MSLLATASPWSNDNSSSIKRRPSTMRKSIKPQPYNDSNEETQDYPTSETTEEPPTNPTQFMKNYQSLQPATIEESQSVNESRGFKIKDLLNKMTFSSENDGSKLGNFTPPPSPALQVKKEFTLGKSSEGELTPTELLPKNNLQPGNRPMFQNVGVASGMGYAANSSQLGEYNNYKTNYEPSKIVQKPYYSNMGIGVVHSGNLDNKLLEKINYMIHLLEEQQNEKTNNITEEFVLYTFLGVFIIFVVDSFARAGKYVR